ncbi:hypothetical protein DFQ26_000277 [Actinomortierella ambigua]|nr:hypothetical protein DFQ26_000277 [Actinomortierella ambigua]
MITVQEGSERLFVPHPGHEAQSQSVSHSTAGTITSCQQTTTLCPPSPSGGAAPVPSTLSLHGFHNSARSVSHRSSVASTARRSTSTIHSHVSDFQNIRFDPDPAKDISLWGGIALLISNMTGPGLITLPILAQQAGWLPTIAVFLLIGLLSSLSSLFICEAMTEVPGNEYFQSNVEFSNLVLCFFGKRYHVLVQVVFLLAMQTTNIASIAVCAQLFDSLLITLFHQTCGIQIAPHAGFICVKDQVNSASPFTGVMIVSTGVLVALAMILPLAFLKLSENIWIQLASFILVLFVVLQWIVTFFIHGLDSTMVPAVGSDISQIFGTVLFNYTFITTVPSWANAKKPSVSIHKTVGYSVGITTIMYILVAILGGMAFHIPQNSTLIQAINSSPQVSVISLISGYTYPIAALITSIPINIIVIRYNLIQSGVCNMFWSNILSAVTPWLVAVPCMTGSGLTTVINWSSLFLLSTANFIIPFVLYIYSKKHKHMLKKLPIIEQEQHARLSREASRSSYSGFSRRPGSMAESLRQRSNQTFSDLHAVSSATGAGGYTAPPSPGGRSISHHPGRSSDDHQQSSSYSETNLWADGHRRLGTNQTGSGPWPSLDTPTMSGPYFSFARDGEIHDRDGSRSSSQPPTSAIRPSGTSTVILHDPVTEMAQRKANLPRRLSRKDRILSLISERHKRALEQQQLENDRMQEQSEKPVPPMILLSQSTTDLPLEGLGEKDTDTDRHQQHSRGNYSGSSLNMPSATTYPIHHYQPHRTRASSTGTPISDFEGSSTDAAAGKRANRKSSVLSAALNKFNLGFVPSSPPTYRMHNTTCCDNRGTASDDALSNNDTRPHSTELPGRRSPSSPNLAHSVAHSPVSPKKSALKKSPTHSPNPGPSALPDPDSTTPRPSLSLPVLSVSDMNPHDAGHTTHAAMDSSRLSPSGLPTTSNQSPRAIVTPSTPDSASTSPLSPRTPDRRVSFSDDRPQSSLSANIATTLSTPLAPPSPGVHLERKPSFSSETKKAVKAAFQSLTGGSPKPFASSSSPSPHSPSAADAREGSQMLLRRKDSDSRDSTSSTSSQSLGDEHDLGPELDVAKVGEGVLPPSPSGLSSAHDTSTTMAGGWMAVPTAQPHRTPIFPKSVSAAVASQGRRDSIGRMAAAFSSQPGSFAIKTSRPVTDQQSQPQPPQGISDVPQGSLSVVPHVTLPGPLAIQGQGSGEPSSRRMYMTLSPSSPPLLPIPPTAAAAATTLSDFALMDPSTMRSNEPQPQERAGLQMPPQQQQPRNHVRSVSASVVDSTLHSSRNVQDLSRTTQPAAASVVESIGEARQATSAQSVYSCHRDSSSASASYPTLLAVSTATTPTMQLTPPSPLLSQDAAKFGTSVSETTPHPCAPEVEPSPQLPPIAVTTSMLEPHSPCTPPPAHSYSHSRSLSVSPWTGHQRGNSGSGGSSIGSHRRQSSHQQSSHVIRSSPSPGTSRTIAPPFLGGHNYSILGYHPGQGSHTNHHHHHHGSGNNKSPTSDYFPLTGGAGVGGFHPEDDGVSGRRGYGRHTREHSRSTMASTSGGSGTLLPPGTLVSSTPTSPAAAPLPGVLSSLPPPSMVIVPGHEAMFADGGTASSTAAAITTTTTAVASAVVALSGGGGEGSGQGGVASAAAAAAGGGGGGSGRSHTGGRPALSESQWTLPQHHQQILADFDALWSLRAIPKWVPMSSLAIAWSSLGVLCFGIGATVVYDFVQLGLGHNPVG